MPFRDEIAFSMWRTEKLNKKEYMRNTNRWSSLRYAESIVITWTCVIKCLQNPEAHQSAFLHWEIRLLGERWDSHCYKASSSWLHITAKCSCKESTSLIAISFFYNVKSPCRNMTSNGWGMPSDRGCHEYIIQPLKKPRSQSALMLNWMFLDDCTNKIA
jgi:hypothetical protein